MRFIISFYLTRVVTLRQKKKSLLALAKKKTTQHSDRTNITAKQFP